MDRYRLVFPIHASPSFYMMFELVYGLVMPASWIPAVCAGTAAGYISYDMIHYFTHHFDFKCGHIAMMKKYHMQHHYKHGEIGFGVSQKFWDYVFGTAIPGL